MVQVHQCTIAVNRRTMEELRRSVWTPRNSASNLKCIFLVLNLKRSRFLESHFDDQSDDVLFRAELGGDDSKKALSRGSTRSVLTLWSETTKLTNQPIREEVRTFHGRQHLNPQRLDSTTYPSRPRTTRPNSHHPPSWRSVPDALLHGHRRAHWWVPARTPTVDQCPHNGEAAGGSTARGNGQTKSSTRITTSVHMVADCATITGNWDTANAEMSTVKEYARQVERHVRCRDRARRHSPPRGEHCAHFRDA